MASALMVPMLMLTLVLVLVMMAVTGIRKTAEVVEGGDQRNPLQVTQSDQPVKTTSGDRRALQNPKGKKYRKVDLDIIVKGSCDQKCLIVHFRFLSYFHNVLVIVATSQSFIFGTSHFSTLYIVVSCRADGFVYRQIVSICTNQQNEVHEAVGRSQT